MARPLNPARPSSWPALAGGVAALVLVAWSAHGTQVDLATLLGPETWRQMGTYAARLFPPDLSSAAVRDAARGAVETFAISLLGSLLAVVIGLPLSLVGARTLMFRGRLFDARPLPLLEKAARLAVFGGVKSVLNVLRTVPELVWAMMFVFVVGLGPFAGVLALGVHTAGVLGKLFGEVLEAVEPAPLEALQATGASRFRIVVYGVLPQALPQFVAYALYRWEVNIRVAAMMGFIGAGGLGQRIYVAISLFHEHQLLTLILAIYVIVTLVDLLSAYLRSRVL
jgi:phosphonate transport system permease protein